MTFQKDAEKHERKALHKLVDFKNQRVLEVGCGEGRLTWEYAYLAQQLRPNSAGPHKKSV